MLEIEVGSCGVIKYIGSHITKTTEDAEERLLYPPKICEYRQEVLYLWK